MLKVRISGILTLLINRIFESDQYYCTITLLKFISKCLKKSRKEILLFFKNYHYTKKEKKNFIKKRLKLKFI